MVSGKFHVKMLSFRFTKNVLVRAVQNQQLCFDPVFQPTLGWYLTEINLYF